jgi:RNA polymerase sigma factor (sigma-70 family)
MSSPPSLAEFAFAHYRTPLHRYLLRRTGNRQLAEDLAQEAFLRLCSMKHAESVRAPQAYLFQVASHLFYEWMQRKRVEVVTVNSCIADLAGNVVRDQSAHQSNALEEQEFVERLLERLPPLHATILLLKKREGKSVNEIADELGYSAHTIKKYLAQAIAMCRMQISEGKDW